MGSFLFSDLSLSLSLSLLCLLCFCSVFFLCVTCVCSFSSLGFLVLSLSPASSVYFFYAFPSFSPCLRLRPPVLPSCSRFSARRPSVQGAVQPETGLVLVRWLANASLCFCLVCFSSRPLVFFCVLPPLVFVLSLFCRFCFWRLVLKKDEVDGDVEVWFSLYFFFFLFFLLLSLPLLCSAFYRARELAKTSPCYSPAFTGLLINPRAGSWAKDVVHDRIELLQFSPLNRLSPREMKGIMNSSSKRRRLCHWE